ncbi:lysophospholipid acyltransferase family protein [Pontiellaceae bacterium B1224]|nr:lysophospholipid acyltransferase family protein [Pontiellaceae bacterium B1224]
MNRLKTIRRAIRQPLETFFFRVAILAIPLLPRFLITLITYLLGTITYYVAKRERTIGLANLEVVFGNTISTAEKRAILKKSLISFTRTMTDIFWFSMNTEKRLRKYQTFIPDSGPYFEEKAHVIITAHTGNWELIGLESGQLGINVASVAAVTKNAAIDKLLNRLRKRTGMEIIAREGAMRTLVSRFRNQGKAAFVLDQNTAEDQGGIWIDFLGMPTPVSAAPAHLAYRTGTDIIFAFSQPGKDGTYEAHTGPVITPPPFDKTHNQAEVVAALTQQIMDVVSEQIRTHPESWLWSYKHWKQIKPGTDPAMYPAYN